MKKPRFSIRELEGEVIVQLHDSENCLVLKEVMDEGQDPYLFIDNIRRCVSEAEITEFPRLPKLEGSWRQGYAKTLRDQIGAMEDVINELRSQIAALETEQPEKSFTDGLN
jgi:F0F1-type ATP synthase beta subunit